MAVDLLVYGAGGSGWETAWLGERWAAGGVPDQDGAPGDQTISRSPGTVLGGGAPSLPPGAGGGGGGLVRGAQRITAQLLAEGAELATLVHPDVERSRFVEIGRAR